MTNGISLETLIAYVDGELDGHAASRVEALLAESPEARHTVRDFAEGAALVRAAHNEALRRPVPETLWHAIDTASGNRVARAAAIAPVRLAIALAACLAIVVGAGGSYLVSRLMTGDDIAQLEEIRLADRKLIETVVNDVLEKRLSGATVDWRSADSGRHGSVTLIRTFRSTGGNWCREYLRTTIAGTWKDLRRAIACREPDGNWRTRLEALGES